MGFARGGSAGARLGLAAARLARGTAHDDERVARPGHAAFDEHEIVFRHDLHDALVHHGDGPVAVLPGHAHARERTARRLALTDGAAVTAVLVRTVRLHVAGEMMTADDAGKPAPAHRALHVDDLPDLEHIR